MNKQSLYRISAVIYADSNIESRKTETIRRKFVEAVFVEQQNVALTIQEIGVSVDKTLEILLTDDEVRDIVSDKGYFVEMLGRTKAENKYSLTPERYRSLSIKSQDNIEATIKKYLSDAGGCGEGKSEVSSEEMGRLLNRYLFLLMDSNILAYRQVLDPSSVEHCNGVVEHGDFTKDEIEKINKFLQWKDSTKDKELYKLVSCCIEYAIVVNNSQERVLIDSFKNKVFYIDNAIIYRAIGINGEIRKKRTLSFIRKCRESGQELRISKFSYKEFLSTIDFHLNQLNKTTPFGRINPKLFHRYASGEGFYQFYHTWRGNRATYSFDIFRNHIISEYRNLIKMYGITEDYDAPYSEDDEVPEIARYTEEIKAIKQGRGHDDLHKADARNMYWIECMRDGRNGRMTDTKYYFVTSDQKLQLWDYSHSHNQPITLLPSQWMALLLKYYSRTNDDYNSFVSFLSLSHDDPGLSPEELQDILAGISQTTEDFNSQALIVEAFLETDWEKQHQDTPMREKAKEYAKDKLEERFAQQILEKEKEYGLKMDMMLNDSQIQIESIKEAFRQQLEQTELQAKRDRLSMISQQLSDVSAM